MIYLYFKEYENCNLCPRNCGANRNSGAKGFCNMPSTPKIARAALHEWEEPCISGERGSGTVFFSGCNLRCCYCQNFSISHDEVGEEADTDRLSTVFIKLQKIGAHNINLVTAEHFAPHIKEAVLKARKCGLTLPVILNSSGYVSVETLEMLKDTIDIFLVDFKYMDSSLGEKYSLAKDYPEIVKKALRKMTYISPELIFDEDAMLRKGVIVRHLCLPGHTEDSKKVINYVFKTYGECVRLSIMSQYTPMMQNIRFENLKRELTEREYDSVIDFCLDIGIEDAYIQEGGAASESFIPDFTKNIIL